MEWEGIQPAPVYVRNDSSKSRNSTSGEYLAVPLPELVNKMGWSKGDKIYLTLSSTEINGSERDYLKASKEKIGRHKRKVRHRSDRNPSHFISIPVEYTERREDQGFHGLEEGDTLIVETDFDNECINIFRGDYVERMKQIREGRSIPYGLADPVNDVPIAAGKFVPFDALPDEHIQILGSVPEQVEVGERFNIVIQISALGLREANVKFKEEDERFWNQLIWFREIEGEFFDFVVHHSFSSPGVYEFWVKCSHELGKEEKYIDPITVVESSK